MEIYHQTQPTKDSCASTAIAMILGKDASEVIEDFHDKFMAWEISFYDYLKDKINCEQCIKDEEMLWGYLYILTVPSLNIKGGAHIIICDCRYENHIKIYDPAMGKEDKMHYIYLEDFDPFNYESKEGEWPLNFYQTEVKINDMSEM